MEFKVGDKVKLDKRITPISTVDRFGTMEITSIYFSEDFAAYRVSATGSKFKGEYKFLATHLIKVKNYNIKHNTGRRW